MLRLIYPVLHIHYGVLLDKLTMGFAITVELHPSKALFSLDPNNQQLHCFLGLETLFCCSFFCPLDQPCKTLQIVQVAPMIEERFNPNLLFSLLFQAPMFSWPRLRDADPLLKCEMASTGEVRKQQVFLFDFLFVFNSLGPVV